MATYADNWHESERDFKVILFCLLTFSRRHFSRIDQTARTGTSALLGIPSTARQLCLDHASFRAAKRSKGGSSISSVFHYRPSCSLPLSPGLPPPVPF